MIVRYSIPEHLPLPARNVLSVVQAALKVARPVAKKLIHDGAVSVGERVLNQTHFQLKVGQVVEIDYVPQPHKPSRTKRGAKSSAAKTFEVVHDDPDIIVVHKPAGLLTVPSPMREKNNLREQIRKWLAQNSAQSEEADAICVQRLDRGVSGLLVFAKHSRASEALIQQFSSRKPDRRYIAIVQGVPKKTRATIRSFLATDAESLNRYSVENEQDGELAITHYEVMDTWGEISLLSVRLETGRRNQIRVHMAEAGHPIVGDPRYRPRLAEHPAWPHRRIALHAERLGFDHPMTGEKLVFESSWPQEFRDLRKFCLKKTGRKRAT